MVVTPPLNFFIDFLILNDGSPFILGSSTTTPL